MSLTLQHNRKTFLTNHKTAYPDLAAYHIYMHVLLALSPKMAPISKNNWKQGLEPPLILILFILLPSKLTSTRRVFSV
jgi:hypothetical protein